MCEMRIVSEQDGGEKVLGENITKLEVLANGVRVTSLFKGATEMSNMVIDSIDFTAGKIVLGEGKRYGEKK